MDKELSLSVVIPSYYRPKYLIQTIQEVLDQNHPALLEIIVADQTPQAFYKKEDWLQIKQWNEVGILIYSPLQVANANAARNRCLQLAKGDVLLLLDDDVLLPKGFIEEHFKMYRRPFQEKTVVAIGGKSHHRKLNIKPEVADLITLDDYKPYTSADFSTYQNKLQSLKAEDTLVGCNMSFLRKAALEIQGFDENFTSYYDEADFCFRLKKYSAAKQQVLLINQDAYLIHLRAPGGGHRLRSDKLSDELPRQLSYNLFYIRHTSIAQAIPKIVSNLRVGPFKKSNFLNFKRFFSSFFYYFKSIYRGVQLKNKIQSPF